MWRGEVWWVHFNQPIGHRPGVLLTRDGAYEVRTHVTLAPVTRSGRPIGSHVRVGPGDGLRQLSFINLDDIQTVPKSWLEQRITTLSAERMAEVDAAIKFALGIR